GNPVPQSLGLLGGDTELIRHTYQIDQRPGLHLPHDVAAMDLHRCLAQLKLSCNLLVRASSDDECEDFSFARCQDIKAVLQAVVEPELLASSSITFDPCLDRIKQILFVKRFGEELDGAGFDCPYRHRNISVAGDKYDRKLDARFRERTLKIQPACPG